MRRILCLICPPLAVLSCGQIAAAILNIFLIPFFYIPAVKHAWQVVDDYYRDRRSRRVVNAIEALQEPLLLQAEATALSGRRRKRARLAPPPAPEPIVDPYIGTNGRVFRRRV
jgi:uncharacterized membrane protein YqaE (UPF0057 family)